MLDTTTLLDRMFRGNNNDWNSELRGVTLSSAFQPLISLNHRRVVGQEALLRVQDRQGKNIGPIQLLNSCSEIADTIELDRMCRMLHGFNYTRYPSANEWLFLNVSPDVINHGHEYGSFFSQLLQNASIPPSQVVIEVLENQVNNEAQLSASVDYYRQLGCLIAIDDFGSGHSNIDRVLQLEPEIVKLDRSMLDYTTAKGRRVLRNLVSLLHEAGCLVVLEGIETEEQCLLAYEVDVDIVQGYYFSVPVAEPVRQLPSELFQQLDRSRQQHQDKLSKQQRGAILPYHQVFEQVVDDYESGIGFTRATQKLLQTEGVQRIYLMDEEGFLVGNNHCPQQISGKVRQKMAPVNDANGSNLANRHYFRLAMAHAGNTKTSRPYLSTTGGELCITLSRRVERGGKVGVICCDFAPSESI